MRNRKILYGFAMIVVILSFLVTILVLPVKEAVAADAVVKFKVADAFPIGHFISADNLHVFMKLVQEKTNNRVQFDYYPAGQLGKTNDMLELLKSGAVDVAFIGTAYVAGKLPLSGAIELPGIYPNASIGSEAFWRLITPGGILYTEEFSKHNVYPVTAIALPPYEIYNNKIEVRTLSDVKGLKLRTAGGTMDLVIKALGAIPVAMPPAEAYDAISKKVLDGVAFPAPSINPYKLQEVLKYATRGTTLCGWVGTYCFSKKAWNALSENDRKIVMECGLESTRYFGDSVDKKDLDYMKSFAAGGMKINYLTEQEKETFKKALVVVENEWLQNQNKRNLPGQAVLEETKKTVADITSKSKK